MDFSLQKKLNLRLEEHTIRFKYLEDLTSFTESVKNLKFTRFRFEVLPYGKDSVPRTQFMKIFAPHIKHLSVRQMNMCILKEELEFYNSLASIESLQIDQILPPDGNCRIYSQCDNAVLSRPCKTPFDFTYQFKVCIPQIITGSLKSLIVQDNYEGFYINKLLSTCLNLNHLNPGYEHSCFKKCQALNEDNYVFSFNTICEYIKGRKRLGNLDEFSPLEIDISEFKIPPSSESPLKFLTLFSDCHDKLSLLNVPPEIFYTLNEWQDCLTEEEHCGLLCAVKSLNRLRPITLKFELPLLETLEFNCEFDCTSFPTRGKARWLDSMLACPEWSALKSITGKMTLYQSRPDTRDDFPNIPRNYGKLFTLRSFLFDQTQGRQRVTKIQFTFVCEDEKAPVIFYPEHFAVGFPNLQELHINVPSFKKSQYTHLFDLLGRKTRIKELTIETAVVFDDYTFLGVYDKDYDEEPSFNKMKSKIEQEAITIFKYMVKRVGFLLFYSLLYRTFEV